MIGTVVVAILIIGVIVPLMSSIVSTRAELSAQHEQVVGLQAQQHDVAGTAKQYETLQTQEQSVSQKFLTEGTSVDFFNAIDALVTSAGASNSQLRIDTPARTKDFQMLGIHLTFNASYRSVITFVRGLSQMKELIAVTNVSISSASSGTQNSVTIDAQIPWNQPL